VLQSAASYLVLVDKTDEFVGSELRHDDDSMADQQAGCDGNEPELVAHRKNAQNYVIGGHLVVVLTIRVIQRRTDQNKPHSLISRDTVV